MIVLDANILLYAQDSTSPHHLAARGWIDKVFSGKETIGLPWQSVWAFLRISTNKQIYTAPLSMEQAIDVVEEWIELPQVQLMVPGGKHWGILKEMLLKGRVRGPQSTDGQLAAIAIEYGGILHTTDRGFARYPGLRWFNPLDSA
jgi:toxin-antitoxin system PIN domain toxin